MKIKLLATRLSLIIGCLFCISGIANHAEAREAYFWYHDGSERVKIRAYGSLDMSGFSTTSYDDPDPNQLDIDDFEGIVQISGTNLSGIGGGYIVPFESTLISGGRSYGGTSVVDLGNHNYSSNFYIYIYFPDDEDETQFIILRAVERDNRIFTFDGGVTKFDGTLQQRLGDNDFHIEVEIGTNKAIFSTRNPADRTPVKPTGLSAEAGDSSVKLTWNDPNDTIPITTYQYQQKTGSGSFGSWQDIPESDADTTSHTVTGLTNGTEYVFQIRAVNATREGEASDTDTATPQAPPAKPSGFSAIAGDGQVILRWEDPSNSAITKYRVRHKEGTSFEASDDLWGDISGSGSGTTSHTVTGLTNGTEYVFQIRAVVLVEGTESDVATATPMAEALTLTGTPVTVTEGGTAETFTVALNIEPTENVTVTVTSGDTEAVAVSPASLTFTKDNYSVAQTVTVTPVEDDDAAGESVTLTLDATGGGYDDADSDVMVTVNDDESATLTLSATTVTVTEGGAAGTFTVALSAEPTENVTVTVTSGNTEAATVSPASLTFTTENYSAAQTVTVTPVEDDDAAGESVTVTLDATGGGYDDVDSDVTVTVNDDESATLTLSATTVTVTEGGAAGTFTVALSVVPTENVTVSVSSGDVGAVTVSPASMTFTADNYTTAQTVTVTPVNDDDAANESVTVSLDATGGGYNAAAATVTVTVNDDDTPAKPAGFSAIAGGGQVELSWSNPNDSSITKYQVRHKEGTSFSASDDLWVDISGSGSGTTSHIVTGLTNGTEYVFQIRAVNAVGEGPASDEARAIPLGNLTPTFGAATIANQSYARYTEIAPLQLPSATSGNGTLTYSLSPKSPEGLTFDATTLRISGTPTATQAATEYTYTATDEDGDSVELKFTITVELGVPRAPTGLKTTSRNGSVVLGWTDPMDASISKYQYQLKEGMGSYGDWTDIPGSVGSTTSYTVTGLTNGTEYGFRLRAVNAIGEGEASEEVTVIPVESSREEKRLLKETLAGISRATLSGASEMIGGRFESGGVASNRFRLGRNAELLFVGGTEENKRGIEAGSSLEDVEELEDPRLENIEIDVGEILKGSEFELSYGGESSRVPSWTLWGRGDFVWFEGSPEDSEYKGELQSGWMGVDMRISGGLLAGLAVSRSWSESDYSFGEGEGELETELTTVWPYAQYRTEGGGKIEVMVGVGRGEARNVREGGEREEEDLEMEAIWGGTSWPVLRMGSIDLSVKGDASIARMETGGEEVVGIGGISVDLWRVRGGLEAARGEGQVRPFGSVAMRYEGGGGVSGTGMELEGGMRITGMEGRFGLEGRGRWLALHSEGGYREWGMSVAASLSSREDGRGLSMSLGPNWGSSAESADILWGEDVFDRGLTGSEAGEASLSARAGYGIGILSSEGLLTPYVEGEGASSSRRYEAGVEMGVVESSGSKVDARLSAERFESEYGLPENRLGVDLRFNF